jgi:hypothetical protein
MTSDLLDMLFTGQVGQDVKTKVSQSTYTFFAAQVITY